MYFQIKTRNLRKHSVVFFKAFSKKKYLADPIFLTPIVITATMSFIVPDTKDLRHIHTKYALKKNWTVFPKKSFIYYDAHQLTISLEFILLKHNNFLKKYNWCSIISRSSFTQTVQVNWKNRSKHFRVRRVPRRTLRIKEYNKWQLVVGTAGFAVYF